MLGGDRKWVAFLSLINFVDVPQTATLVFNIEGVTQPYRVTRVVPACGATVVSVHSLPNFPATANFRVQIGWPSLGSGTLTMRQNTEAFWDREIIPPVTVIR